MAFEKNIPSINLNTDISSYSGGVKSVSDAPVAISMTTKIVLTEQQKQEMLLLGLDPADENQVNQYLSMTPEAIAVLKQEQMAQIPDAPSEIHANDTPQTDSNEQIPQQATSEVETHTHTETISHAHAQHTSKEHNHDFELDTSSEEWESMSNEQKMKVVLIAGAKSSYTDEEWAALSEKEKEAAIDRFLNEELTQHYPGWKDAKTVEEQLNLLSEFIDENKMSKEFNISFNELIELKVNNPDKYQKIASEYYQTHDKTDLYADAEKAKQTKIIVIKDAYESALELYCKDNNLNVKAFKNSPAIKEFNQNYAKQHGIKTLPESAKLAQYHALSKKANINNKDVQKRYEFINQYIETYGEEFLPRDIKNNKLAIEELVKNNGRSFEGLSDGDISINELFKDANFTKNKTGHTDWRSKENINKADAILREQLGITKDDTHEDIFRKVRESSLNAEAKIKAMEVFLSKQNNNQVILDENKSKSFDRGLASFLIGALSRGGSGQNEVVFKNLVYEQYGRIKKTGGKTDGLNDAVKSAGKNFEQENAAGLNLLGARLEDKGMIDAANEGIAQREDVLEVLKLSNKLFNESEAISDEMKEYYAQSTVEHLQTPEQRSAQAGDLKSYNNESFNTGVATGLANVDANQVSSRVEAPAQNNSADVSQISGAQYSGTAEVVATNNVIQEIKTTITDELTGEIKLDLNKQEDRDKLLELFEQHPLEMAKYIQKAPLKNKEAMLIALCQSSKTAAILFVKQNPSFGLIILSSSQVELGVQRDVALVMIQKADRGSDVWKTASEFIGKFYKGEASIENKKSLMLKA